MMLTVERKAKIKWNCRRGMLELDLILQGFVTQLDGMSEEQIQAFENILNYPDPDLYAWLMGYESPAHKELVDIVSFIRFHDSA